MDQSSESNPKWVETEKRKREIVIISLLGVLFVLLTWLELRLFGMSRSLPYEHSIFFFGLVNFNIIVLLLLLFLVFRNVVKVFSERQRGLAGSSLKGKLIAAFVGFSFVPTALMFLVSVVYINNSFEKWFSEKMAGVLKSSLEVTNAYYLSAKKENYHFASLIAESLKPAKDRAAIEKQLERLRKLYRRDAVEFYTGLFGQRVLSLKQDDSMPRVPAISMEFRKRGIGQRAEASTIHPFGEGNLVRVIAPFKYQGKSSAIVVSSFVPISLISRMDDITSAYEQFRDADPLAYPLKSIYLIILVLMTLVILFGATWFGFYLAKQLSIPLEVLGRAARRVAKGDYRSVRLTSGSPEINQLVQDFNTMTSDLGKSQEEITEANSHLRQTLDELDKHTKYIEVVLANVSTGVVSVDNEGVITMINQRAAELLEIEASAYLGQSAASVLELSQLKLFRELLDTMKKHQVTSIQKEMRLDIKGRSIPFQMTLSVLKDDSGNEQGKVLVFDDLSMVVSAQRAAAWTEVARRIAHEIKNPLTPISLAAQRLQKKFGREINDVAFSECTSMIIHQVDDLKELVNEFSRFARMPKSQLAMGSLNRVIEETLILYQQGQKGVNVDFEADPALPEFRLDQDQMKRVVMNLVDNAIAALQGQRDGKVKVRTEFDPQLTMVRLFVEDNGPGIPRSLRERIFEPYVTSKKQGTGLGLAIVKRTVEDHNGFIRARALKPRGTQFLVELPTNVQQEDSKPLSATAYIREDRIQ